MRAVGRKRLLSAFLKQQRAIEQDTHWATSTTLAGGETVSINGPLRDNGVPYAFKVKCEPRMMDWVQPCC